MTPLRSASVFACGAMATLMLGACGADVESNAKASASAAGSPITKGTVSFDVTFSPNYWRVRAQGNDSITLDGIGGAAIVPMQNGTMRSGTIQISSSTLSTPVTIETMTSNWMRQVPGTSVRTCLDDSPQQIGGISGMAIGVCYMMRDSEGTSMPQMETFWRATSATGTAAYMVWIWSSAFNFFEVKEMATPVIDSIHWKLA